MTDILGAVNDFVLRFCKTPEIPVLEQFQIVRGWQNMVSALPKNCREYVVLTLLASIRHGTNVHDYYAPENSETGLNLRVAKLDEHLVQVDFCAAYPDQNEEIPRTRADILEMLTRDAVGVDFYKSYGLSSLYADDVRPLPFLDGETKQWVARYSVTLHLEGWNSIEPYADGKPPVDSFSELGIYLENVDVHHPV